MFQPLNWIPGPEIWTAVFTGILAFTGVAALWIARSQLGESHSESQVQHLLALEQKLEQEPMLSYRRGLAEKRLKGQKDPDELFPLLDFFETVGLLVKRGYLDESDVWNTFAYPVFILNADAHEIIEQGQREDRTYYSEFSFLVERLQGVEAKNKGTSAHPSKEEISEYYQLDLSAGRSTPVHRRPRKKPSKK